MKLSMIETSDLVMLTSSSNHAINVGSMFWGETPSGTLKTPAPFTERRCRLEPNPTNMFVCLFVYVYCISHI